MPDGPNAGQSYESWIESMAGASPPEVKVWVCPDCGSAERHDDPTSGNPPYTPYCEWCADDPEGGGEVSMVLHYAVPVSDWPQPVPPPYEADDEDEATPDE